VSRAVFLDRDGVLAEAIVRDNKAYAPLSLDEYRLVDEASRQVARLRAAGFKCLVFTNQPEVSRGLLDPELLEEMHALLRAEIPVDAVYTCPHDAEDECDCRKPGTGMLKAAKRDWNLDLEKSFVVGDRWRDIEAGRSAGCFTVLIERAYSECSTADVRVSDLGAAVDRILARIEGL
jgi:D-glycero-D-manno-heptose 1,7-bisphosphate phosphatase